MSDTAHHQLVELDADLTTERRRLGDGTRGLRDAGAPRFSEPQTNEGLRDRGPSDAFLAQPSGLAAGGDTLWVADSAGSTRSPRPSPR